MIVDYLEPGWSHVYPPIYERTRDKDGELHVRILKEMDEGYIKPHCWIPRNTPAGKLQRLVNRYQGVEIKKEELATAIDGHTVLMKVVVREPETLWELKNDTWLNTYDADKPFTDQYLIHNYPDKIPEFHPRVWYFDLEWDVKEDFTTVMAVDDTHAEHPVVFAWRHDQEKTVDWIDREDGYMLHLFDNEKDMHDAFLNHMDACDPDILVAHALMWADLPHLMRRLEDPTRLSPIREVAYPHKKRGYTDTQQPIRGRLCYDTAVPAQSGSGIENMWLKSGRGQLPNRKLQTIAEELGFEGKLEEDEDGNKLDVKTWWYTHFDLFVDYCLRDTTLLRKCDEKVNSLAFLISMQQYCGVRFQSIHRVTNYVRGLFSRYSEYKPPSMRENSRKELKAANVLRTIPGRHEHVGLVDFASMYPRIIVDLNLCPTTKRDHGGEGIRQLGDGSYWYQGEQGVLPRIVKDMLELRVHYKKLMSEATNEDDRFKFDMMQLAVKICTNAIYGYVSQKKIGGMWTDPDVGAAITFTGRGCIDALFAKAEENGYRVLAGHTDSCYIQAPFDELQTLVPKINEEMRKDLGLPTLDVELEAFFDYWLTADVKNRNFGIITWPEKKAGHLKVTGYEHKAANASPISKEVQEIAFRLIGAGSTEEEVYEALRPIVLSTFRKQKSVEEVAAFGRMGKAKYERVPPNAAKAMLYYNHNLSKEEPFLVNDQAQWVYVSSVPDDMPHTNVVAFREASDIDDFTVDYGLLVEKFIRNKLESIYDVLDWDIANLCEMGPKRYFL
tara:strand:- start:2491 stop:4836 length:2346 start_codon:yes stop_codon:yes gene_type:complete